jgi:HK97 family phage prohead protease
MSIVKREYRFASELRAKSGSKVLAGYAAKFNSRSQDLGGFREQIAPGAFTKTLAGGADVRALVNHDPSMILGRNKSGTLRLEQDSIGLAFEIDMPDTQMASDVLKSVQRGDIDGCSFGMICTSDNWQDASDSSGYYALRTVNECELFDVSVVTYPAYASTSVEARSARMFPDGIITIPTMSEQDRAWVRGAEARIQLALLD